MARKIKNFVPIISCNDPRFVRKFGMAFEETGFAVLKNHGIPQHKILRLRRASRALFDLGREYLSNKYEDPALHGQRGFCSKGEKAKGSAVIDYKDFWHVGDEAFGGLQNIWPDEVAEFKMATLDIFAELKSLARWLLGCIEKYAGLPADFVSNMIEGADTILRLVDYPETTVGRVRAGTHADINLITLLLGAVIDGELESSEPRYTGLDVQDRHGNWHQVFETQNCIVVNVGDMLQTLFELLRALGFDVPRFISTPHRVVAAEGVTGRRGSYPMFVHAKRTQIIRLLENGQLQTAEEYLFERLRELGLMPALEHAPAAA